MNDLVIFIWIGNQSWQTPLDRSNVENEHITFRNHKLDYMLIQTVHEGSLDDPLQSWYNLCGSKIQDGHHSGS